MGLMKLKIGRNGAEIDEMKIGSNGAEIDEMKIRRECDENGMKIGRDDMKGSRLASEFYTGMKGSRLISEFYTDLKGSRLASEFYIDMERSHERKQIDIRILYRHGKP
ncbi:hypothetical protein CEXT_781391 [Caerostris extrusa]|uniref:Uncharacterized protein n=1 Tax=Caerostris extrusa TaxID=172846 RepID=A0AAV4WTG6_CAEEX|nr:hypothetical protein CEXT_781391 [Caerostris extrusa]